MRWARSRHHRWITFHFYFLDEILIITFTSLSLYLLIVNYIAQKTRFLHSSNDFPGGGKWTINPRVTQHFFFWLFPTAVLRKTLKKNYRWAFLRKYSAHPPKIIHLNNKRMHVTKWWGWKSVNLPLHTKNSTLSGVILTVSQFSTPLFISSYKRVA